MASTCFQSVAFAFSCYFSSFSNFKHFVRHCWLFLGMFRKFGAPRIGNRYISILSWISLRFPLISISLFPKDFGFHEALLEGFRRFYFLHFMQRLYNQVIRPIIPTDILWAQGTCAAALPRQSETDQFGMDSGFVGFCAKSC